MTTPINAWHMPRMICAAVVLAWRLAAGYDVPAAAWAGEAPLNAAVRDLVEHPDQYDGRLVVVTGYIGHVAWERGRRGSEYVEIRLDEAATEAGVTEASVTVISWPGSAVRKCQHVLVQGVFHRTGKQAGRPYEFFIDADAVLRDDPGDAGRVPSACDEKL